MISGKDYYRCASHKERGTCGNRLAIRKELIEKATLATLQNGLLTEEHARIFVEEFKRETNRRSAQEECRDTEAEARLRQVELELANLEQNLLAGVLSPALTRLLADREAEKAALQARLMAMPKRAPSSARILPHPALLALFEQKVASLPRRSG